MGTLERLVINMPLIFIFAYLGRYLRKTIMVILSCILAKDLQENAIIGYRDGTVPVTYLSIGLRGVSALPLSADRN